MGISELQLCEVSFHFRLISLERITNKNSLFIVQEHYFKEISTFFKTNLLCLFSLIWFAHNKMISAEKLTLTHHSPVLLIYTPANVRKPLDFVFRRYRKATPCGNRLTNFRLFYFYTPRNNQKTGFSDVFTGYRNERWPEHFNILKNILRNNKNVTKRYFKHFLNLM